MEALELLKTNKSVTERAESYLVSITREIKRTVIDALIIKKEKLQDELVELKDFSLSTDLNQGVKRLTKEECQKRFERMISIEYELALLEAEIKIKQASFNKYFVEEQTTKKK